MPKSDGVSRKCARCGRFFPRECHCCLVAQRDEARAVARAIHDCLPGAEWLGARERWPWLKEEE